MQPKPGIRSSEFIVALIVLAVSNVFAAISPSLAENFPTNPVLQTALPMISIGLAALINIFVSIGWIVARTKVKMAASENTPTSYMGPKTGFSHIGLLLFIPILFSIVILAGCSVEKDWVKASDATCSIVSPHYAKYVEADTDLSETEKKAVRLTLMTWRIRIDEWKKTLEMK